MQALVLQDGESIENDLRIDEHLILISSNLQARGVARGLKVASFWKNAATKVYKRIRSWQKGPLRNSWEVARRANSLLVAEDRVCTLHAGVRWVGCALDEKSKIVLVIDFKDISGFDFSQEGISLIFFGLLES